MTDEPTARPRRASTYWAMTAHYARTIRQWPSRVVDGALRSLPIGLSHRLIRGLERGSRPEMVTIGEASPVEASCLVSSTTVAAAGLLTLPAVAGLAADGHYWSETKVHQLSGVTVDAESGLVFAGGSVIAQSGYGYRSAADAAFLSGAFLRAQRLQARSISGSIAPMGAVWNYYHFLIEDLPRLLHIRSVEPAVIAQFRSEVPPFVREALTRVGVPLREEAPSTLAPESVWLCDPASFAWPRPGDIDALRSAVGVAGEPAGGSGLLYVSRQGSSRSLRDEHALEDLIAARGGSVVRGESLTWAEQIQRFSQARIVVGPHGAGLANAVFMPAGSTLIEVTTGAWWNPCFRTIAAIRGLDYRLVRLPSQPGQPHGVATDALDPVSSLL